MDPITVKEISKPPHVRANLVRRLGQPPSVAVNRPLAQRLSFTHRLRYRLYVRKSAESNPPLPEEPSAQQRSYLGEDGVARVGARVPRHAALVEVPSEGVVYFEGAEWGVVRAVRHRHRDLPRAIAERISVLVEWESPTRLGDWLWTDADDGPRRVGVIDEIVDDGSVESRLYMCSEPPRRQLEVYRLPPTAEQQVQARSVGAYAYLSQRPVTGQVVREEHFQHLAARGCRALLGDLAGYKSDDAVGRALAHQALSSDDPKLADAWTVRQRRAPQRARDLPTGSLRYLDALARVTGLGLSLTPGEGVRLDLRLPTDDPSSWSSGEVRKPETLNYRTLLPEVDGLLCQRIFGPLKDYRCLCGAHGEVAADRTLDSAVTEELKPSGTCESCGVPIGRAELRRVRFGHVALPRPVVPLHLRPLLAEALGEDVEPLIAAMSEDGGARLLERLAPMPPTAEGISPRDLVWRVVPVLPADLRPLVPLAGGRFATSDLNDLYRRVINRSNRMKRLLELNAPKIILTNEHRELQHAVDQLLLNDTLPCPVKYEGKRLLGVFALLREVLRHPKDRRVDYSASATVLVNLKAVGRCVVYQQILAEIARPLLHRAEDDLDLQHELLEEILARRPVLLTHPGHGGAVVAARAVVGRDPVIRVDPVLAARLGVSSGDRLAVHLPLADRAVEEARWLCDAPEEATFATADSGDVRAWIQHLSEAPEFAEEMVALARRRSVDPCLWPPAAVLLGGTCGR